MIEFLAQHSEAVWALIFGLTSAIITRLQEKKALRKKGILQDDDYYKQNGLPKNPNAKKF